MPPKRSRSGTTTAVAGASTSKKQKTAALKPKAKPKTKTRTKSKAKSTRTREIREDSPPEKDFDSYDDAVRDAVLNTTKSRYDVSLEQDHLTFAAALMESTSPSFSIQDDVMMLFPSGGSGGGGVGGQAGGLEGGSQHARVYSLGTFCMHAVVKNFERLAVDAAVRPALKSSAAAGGRAGPRAEQGNGGRDGQRFRRQIQQLPFYLSERLFKVLKHSRPELLLTKLWTGLFFNPDTTAGDRVEELDLEGLISSQVTDTVVRTHLLQTLGVGPRLTRINLNHQIGLSDKVVAGLVGACPKLSRLSLKGCSKVGDLTLASLPEGAIEELNISFVGATACTVKGISGMVLRCRELRVLKVAGLANVKDAVFVQLEKNLALEKEQQQEDAGGSSSGGSSEKKDDVGSRPLSKLENLKISTTSLGDRGLKIVLALCGRTLRRLDISQTSVLRPSLIGQYCVWNDAEAGGGRSKERTTTRLEKLNLTRLTMSTPAELAILLQQLPANSLHTLLMGYITHSRSVFSDGVFEEMSSLIIEEEGDEGQAFSSLPRQENATANAGVGSGETIPPLLRARPKFFLRTLSLFGNHELGQTARDRDALRWHLHTLTPYLKRLELGYTGYDHQVLLGLIDPPHRLHSTADEIILQQGQKLDEFNDILEELGMDATRISDEGAVVLSKLRGLSRLSMANTQITKGAVEAIVAECPRLSSLDLTSCRGVPVVQRRTLLKDIRQRASSSSSS